MPQLTIPFTYTVRSRSGDITGVVQAPIVIDAPEPGETMDACLARQQPVISAAMLEYRKAVLIFGRQSFHVDSEDMV